VDDGIMELGKNQWSSSFIRIFII